MILMITKMKYSLILISLIISGCSLSPGMHVKTEKVGLMKKSMFI